MKKDTQNHKFPQKLHGDWDLIGQQQPKPNDPILKQSAMKGRRWTIDYGYDSGKTFSKLKERFAMANNDTYVDTDHNDWDISYNEFYEHLLKEDKLKTLGLSDEPTSLEIDVDPIVNTSIEIDVPEPEYDDLMEAVLAEKKKKGKRKRKPKPTNPSLWSRALSSARSKFDIYPSAYANSWASKWYKKNGGKWRMG
jgi:hypothetical protein